MHLWYHFKSAMLLHPQILGFTSDSENLTSDLDHQVEVNQNLNSKIFSSCTYGVNLKLPRCLISSYCIHKLGSACWSDDIPHQPFTSEGEKGNKVNLHSHQHMSLHLSHIKDPRKFLVVLKVIML